jgi:hypothetical protein
MEKEEFAPPPTEAQNKCSICNYNRKGKYYKSLDVLNSKNRDNFIYCENCYVKELEKAYERELEIAKLKLDEFVQNAISDIYKKKFKHLNGHCNCNSIQQRKNLMMASPGLAGFFHDEEKESQCCNKCYKCFLSKCL